MKKRGEFTMDYYQRPAGYDCAFAEGSESFYERLPDPVVEILIRREYDAQQLFETAFDKENPR